MKRLLVTLTCCLLLVSCGFSLRGYEQPVFTQQRIKLEVQNADAIHNRTSRNLEKHLTTRLLTLGASVDSRYADRNQLNTNTPASATDNITVKVTDINLAKHTLVGTLTEVQLHMTANVTISSSNKAPLTRPLQLQRSYQYDQATVNTENQQEYRVIELMNEAMADRIARQVALYEQVSAVKAAVKP